jgi:hypothetical protein
LQSSDDNQVSIAEDLPVGSDDTSLVVHLYEYGPGMMVATRTGHPRHLALQRFNAKDSWSSLRPMIAGAQAVPLRLGANFLKNARIVYRGDQDRNSSQLGAESHEIVPREAELEHGGWPIRLA